MSAASGGGAPTAWVAGCTAAQAALDADLVGLTDAGRAGRAGYPAGASGTC